MMILQWTLLAVFVVVDAHYDNYCHFQNGNIGIRVRVQDCPTPEYGYVCGWIGYSAAMCCPVTSFRNTLHAMELYTGTVGHIKNKYSYCQFSNGNLGIRVKAEDCRTPQYGYTCGYIGYSVAICCPVTSFQNIPEAGTYVAVNKPQDNYCHFQNGNLGIRVRVEDCPTPEYGYVCGWIGYSAAMCCPITSLPNRPNDKGFLTGGPVVDNSGKQNYCQFQNGNLGVRVKAEDCSTPGNGYNSGWIGNSVAICCPMTSFQNPADDTDDKGLNTGVGGDVNQTNNSSQRPSDDTGSSAATTKIGNAEEFSRRKCEELLLNENTVGIAVFNGRPAEAKEFRHMAVLGYGNISSPEWGCGAALISEKHVLTAAHCVARETPSIVRLGDLDLSTAEDDAQPRNFKVSRIYYHDDYRPPAKYHDIALIELDKSVSISDYIDVACLDTSRVHSESEYVVMGWGKKEFVGESSAQLLAANLVPFDIANCSRRYGSRQDLYPDGIIDEYMICAGGASDTCNGDSGGPLVVINQDLTKRLNRNIFDIIGVTSFGRPCGLTGDPGIYTRVQPYLSWIDRIVWPESAQ